MFETEQFLMWKRLYSPPSNMAPYFSRKQFESDFQFQLSKTSIGPFMIRNYIKIGLRNLVRNKSASVINIGGLAVGMAVAILNGLWIWDELSFNSSYQNYKSITQVTELGISNNGMHYSNTALPYPLATELKNNYNHYFEHILMAQPPGEYILTAGETKLTRKGMFFEAAAPEMLTLKMSRGNRAGLTELHSILLSESAAHAIFGKVDPMNKLVKINADMNAKVTGVYEDLPHNNEFAGVDFIAPFDLWTSVNPWVAEQQWDNWFLAVYAQLRPGMDAEKVSALIKDVEINNLEKLEGMESQIARKPQIALAPMSRWHLYGSYDVDDKGPVQMVWLIALIGMFVLFLACINFINLATARAAKRAKEVGVRKAIGSMQLQLIGQFFCESFMHVMLAFAISIVLAVIALPWFNNIAAKQLVFPVGNVYFWLASVIFIVITGLIAGSYPAFYLSSFQPVKILKGSAVLNSFRSGDFTALPRKALVILQFTVSVTLIISTFVIYRQIQHARNRPTGYNRSGLLMIEKKTADFSNKFDLLRNELKNTGVVDEVAESRSSVTGITMWNGGFSRNGKEIVCPNGCGTLPVASEYGKTVEWQFRRGRDFDKKRTSDSTGFIINESFAKLTGLQNPVGETVTWAPKGRNPKTYTILGVVQDMVAISPYKPTIPTVYFLENNYAWINIRLNSKADIAAAIPRIETVFRKLIPSAPFEYKFADEEYAHKFESEERIGKMAGVFAILAIFISCSGLFGLASFMAETRTKEIGIRKVLGASVLGLWKMLSADFIILVVISIFLATPVAYFLLDTWLAKYEYRTTISWWIFAFSGMGALVITLLTVSYQSIKAALLNPVRSLRNE